MCLQASEVPNANFQISQVSAEKSTNYLPVHEPVCLRATYFRIIVRIFFLFERAYLRLSSITQYHEHLLQG